MKRLLMLVLTVVLVGTLFGSVSNASYNEIQLVNADFEDTSSGSSTIPGWSQTFGNGGIQLTNTKSFSGANSIYIEDQSTSNYGLESDYIPVVGGDSYYAETYVFAEEGNGLLYIRFFDANQNYITAKNLPTHSNAEWALASVEYPAPSNAAYATILLYSATTTTSKLYYDYVKFFHITVDNELTPVNLGTPIESVVSPHAGYGQGPNGENWVYVVSNGSPAAILSVLDVETGARVEEYSLSGANYVWGNTVDPSGNLYIGSQRQGNFYRYVPGSGTVEHLGKAISTETHLWRIASDDTGNIYGGTYPNGKVFKYDPVSDSFTDYGQMATGEKYVRSVAYGNGIVYAGTGVQNAQIIALDPATGVKTPIPLPTQYQGQKEIYDLSFEGDLLFARITAHDASSSIHNNILVYDTVNQVWVDTLKSSIGVDVSPERNGKVYLWLNEYLYSYDLTTLALTQTSHHIGMTAPRSFEWYTLDQVQFPGESLVFADSVGDIYIYNPQNDSFQKVIGDPKGAGVSLRSLQTGPDGNIYIGGYLSPNGIGVYDVVNEQLLRYKGMPQVDGMGTAQGKLYMGTYPNAVVYEYDPSQAWDETLMTNPIDLGLGLDQYAQDRPFAFTEAGGQLAVGTVAQAGQLGGALALYDLSTGQTDVYKDIITDESIMSLAYHNNLIYGGTSVWGGIASEPTQTDATLFIFDPTTEQVIFETQPILGEKAITSIVFDDQGILWGLTNGRLFTFDPQTLQVTNVKTLYPYQFKDIVLAAGTLNFHNGMLYGESVNHIFELDPQTMDYSTIGPGNYFAQDSLGRIYSTLNSTELIRYDISN